MDIDALSLLIFIVIVTCLCGAIAVVFVSIPRSGKRVGDEEEVVESELGKEQKRSLVKFFIIAVAFIVLIVEAIFLCPWAVVFSLRLKEGAGPIAIGSAFIFMCIFGVSMLYLWGRGIFRPEGKL